MTELQVKQWNKLGRGDAIRVELKNPGKHNLKHYGQKSTTAKHIIFVVGDNKDGCVSFSSAINDDAELGFKEILLPPPMQGITADDVNDFQQLTSGEIRDCLDWAMMWHRIVELDRQDGVNVCKENKEEVAKLRAEADYWKKEYELCKSEQKAPKPDYSQQGITDYVVGAEDIYELATIFSSAAFRLAYATDQFADSKERIVFMLNNKEEYPLQVALVKEAEPLRNVQTEFEHACFMEIHALASPKQIAFRNYCAELMGFFAKNQTLRNFSDIAKKYGVTGLTKEQFYDYKFDQPEWVEKQGTDYIDNIYNQIKKR